ncbi:hypothetical protein PINS_up010418 [Pythium insidiosum]|nr:hypothetical protein PINS_up010418 [Pythium insidiosum]
MSRRTFQVGDRVDGLYDGNSDDVWYPGVIEAAHGDATTSTMTFDVLYDDGEREYGVIEEYLRTHQQGTICVGTRVFGRYAGGDEWYPGKILEVLDDGTFTIEYDDGEIEAGVVLDFIRESLEIDAEPSQVEAEPSEPLEIVAVPVQAVETEAAPSHAIERVANGETDPSLERRRTPSPAPDQEASAVPSIPPETEIHKHADEDDQHHSVHNVDDGCADSTAPQVSAAGIKNHHDVRADRDADADVDTDADAADQSIPHSGHDHSEPVVQPHPQLPSASTSASTSTSAPNRSAPMPAAAAIDEYASVLDAVEQLTTGDLSDPLATKSVLSTLVKQLRASPQATAELLHARDGERLLVAVLQTHHAHAVLQCYGFVLLRRLCFLCGKSAHLLLRLGVLDAVLRAMQRFADDAILQAAACGALAVFTRLPTGLTALLERRAAHLVLATLLLHKAYSVHTRQVHYYASEVLLELCELGDRTTLDALCGDHLTTAPAALRSDGSPIALLLGLLRQALSFDDKKASCAVATLLLCLAACHTNAALLLVTLNGLPELSTVMAAYATEPGVQKYAVAASHEIARCAASMPELSPSRRVQASAHELLLSSLPPTTTGGAPSPKASNKAARASSQPASRKAGKKKPKKTTTFVMTTANGSVTVSELNGFATPAGAAQRLDAVVARQRRDPLSFSRYASPQGKAPPHLPSKLGIAPSPTSYHYAAAPTPPPPHAFASEMMRAQDTDKRQQFVRDERQQLLFDTYGVDAQQATSAHSHGQSGIKRRQLKTHVVSAGSSVKRSAGGLSSRVETETPGMAAPRRQQDDGEGSSEELSPSTLRRRDQQQQQRPKAPRATYQLDLTRSQISVPPQSPVVLSPTTSTARSAPKKPKKKATTAMTTAQTARKSAPHGVNRPRPTGRRPPATQEQSHESLSAFATQLFRDDGDGDISATAAGAKPENSMEPRKPATSQHERERLSFAEKLHKMIDRAKSTLAHSSTTDLEAASSPKKPAPAPVAGSVGSKAQDRDSSVRRHSTSVGAGRREKLSGCAPRSTCRGAQEANDDDASSDRAFVDTQGLQRQHQRQRQRPGRRPRLRRRSAPSPRRRRRLCEAVGPHRRRSSRLESANRKPVQQ